MKNRRYYIKSKVHQAKNKESIFKKPILWVVVLILLIVSSLFYFFVFSSEFQVTFITIFGNNNVQNEDIERAIWNVIDKNISRSIFLVKTDEINKNILDKFPQIERAKVFKKLPSTIVLELTERIPFAAFCRADDKECFNIDKNGVIFEVSQEISENIFLIREITQGQKISLGQKVIEEKVIETIDKIKKTLKDNFQINVISVTISSPFRLDIQTSENWQGFFSLDSDIDFQIAKVNLLLKNEIPLETRKTLQYIDLRFKDKAYYK